MQYGVTDAQLWSVLLLTFASPICLLFYSTKLQV